MPIREWMRDRRVAGALAAVAILFVGYRLFGSGTRTAPAVPANATAPAPPSVVQEPSPLPESSPVPIPPGWTGPAWSWNRNPFLGSGAEGSPEEGIAVGGNADGAAGAREEGGMPGLRGTIVSGTLSMAIFRSPGADGGNRLVPVGGRIGDWTLSRVEPYSVSLRRGAETRVLELYRQ